MKSVNLGKRETPDLMAATPALAEELRITLPELAYYGQNLIRSKNHPFKELNLTSEIETFHHV